MAKSLRIMIVDDEPLAVERLQMLCAAMAGVEVVGTAADGAAAMRLIPVLTPDLLLLDIAMPGLDGMGVARALADAPARISVVFVTAYADYAVAAFDIAATDYLLKPVSADRLQRAIDRVRDRVDAGAAPLEGQLAGPRQWIEEFWVPNRSEVLRIPVSSIDLIAAERDYMRLHVGARSYLLHKTISELERLLDPAAFIRLHRSTIVAQDRIVGFSHNGEGVWEARLKGGRTARVGRSYLARARALAGR
jgi:two-component system response regulator AlgR